MSPAQKANFIPNFNSHQAFLSTMASYLSIDIAKASTFITLATRRTFHPLRKPQFSLHPFHHNKPYHSTTANSISFHLRQQSPSLSLSSKLPRFCRKLRSFSVAASSTAPAAEESTDDIVTKIPPDDRIPATIITGFLGSGKVIELVILLFELVRLLILLIELVKFHIHV